MPPKQKTSRARSEKDAEPNKADENEATLKNDSNAYKEEEVRPPSWVNAFKAVLLQELDHKFSSSVTNIQEKENEICSKIDGFESNMAEVEIVISKLKHDLESSTSQIANLENQIDDLTNRQCRKTLIFKGFPEKCEEEDTCDSCRSFLTEFIGQKFDQNVEIERAHRTKKKFRPSNVNDSNPPRLIFAEFLSWRFV
eukprot:gene1639-1817_t